MNITPQQAADPNYHPVLHLLALERTGWLRWVFGRWVYPSEPFRRDIQRRCATANLQRLMPKHTTLGPEWEANRDA